MSPLLFQESLAIPRIYTASTGNSLNGVLGTGADISGQSITIGQLNVGGSMQNPSTSYFNPAGDFDLAGSGLCIGLSTQRGAAK